MRRLNVYAYLLITLYSLLYAAGVNALEQRFVSLPTRSQVTVLMWVIIPDRIKATAILFSGGGGKLNKCS